MSLHSHPIPKEQLDNYLNDIYTIEDVNSELTRIQKIMILVESETYRIDTTPEESKRLVSHFTQLFKALLGKKEMLLKQETNTM